MSSTANSTSAEPSSPHRSRVSAYYFLGVLLSRQLHECGGPSNGQHHQTSGRSINYPARDIIIAEVRASRVMETDDIMMMVALDSGMMAGQTNGYVSPEDNVTRAVQLMFREHCLLIQT